MKPLLGLSLGLMLTVAAASVYAQDKKVDNASKNFIKAAIEGNNAEIELGKLAQEKGQSDAVKQFGRMLAADHQKDNEEARSVAGTVGVKAPRARQVTIEANLKLKARSGNAFDRAFADAMVSDHDKEIKRYRQQSTKNDPVGQYARRALLTLEKHLQQAQQIQQQLNETTGRN
jgi:putative membrane protein